ncbi:MAG: type II secretion system major pseudopilin GspG [Pirellulaceae bacterium]|nr:type II secretion system major pseudopilin GspG [Pirellulaceae bacterium]
MLTRIHQRRNDRIGFTLMEVLLVMAILVILGSVVVANFGQIFGDAKIDIAKTQLQTLSLPLTKFQFDTGTYPSNDAGLGALRIAPNDIIPEKWRGPYLPKELPADPWGNPYQYEQIDGGYRIWSDGPPNERDGEISVTSSDS